MKKTADKIPAVERRRLERLTELARAHRRTGRALGRAIGAALERGISVRRIAAAIDWPTMNVWRVARSANRPEHVAKSAIPAERSRTMTGHRPGAKNAAKPANPVDKPKESGK